MSNQSNTARARSPFPAPERRLTPVAPVVRLKPAKKEKLPTGFYRRKPGGNLYWRRSINNVDYDESTGFSTIKDAQQWAEDKVQAIRYGHHGWNVKGIPTVQEFFEGRTRTTMYDRWLVPFVTAHAKTKIDQITDDICREWIATRLETDTQYGKPPSPGTVRTECTHLRAFFNRAVGQKKFLRENPWSMVDPECRIKLPKKSVRDRELTVEEQPELLAALRGHGGWEISGAMLERMAKIIIGSGLRRNEICYLQPAMVHHNALHLPTWLTKGKKPRKVPVTSDVLALLDLQRTVRKLDLRSEERYFDIDPIYFDALLKQASETAQLVPNVTPHDLRRTYASRMAFKVPHKVLQLLMGHSDIKTTMEHYVKVEGRKLAEIVAGLESPLIG